MAVYLPFTSVASPLGMVPSLFTVGQHFWRGRVPYSPITDAGGWNETLRSVIPVRSNPYDELVEYRLPENRQEILIPFKVEKVSPALILAGPMIFNVVDEEPFANVNFMVTNLSTSLMTLQLNCLLDSENYWFRSLVSVVK
jgi:hypothetical protein